MIWDVDAVIYQVPYYENIQNIESRLDHVTASAKAQEYIPIEEKDRLGRGHLPLNSFHDHNIVRDARFRLAEALAHAGLQHSDAARQAVAAMNPRPHLAIHGLLQIWATVGKEQGRATIFTWSLTIDTNLGLVVGMYLCKYCFK